jgi:peptidoglycan/xylan/chitin deacetylase (PgdA/CDA1 family)
MGPAEDIARILNAHQVKATFFLANEPTVRGDTSLAPSWADFWRARVAEGHAFGNHTWRHWYFRRDVGSDKVAYVSRSGEVAYLDQAGCVEHRAWMRLCYDRATSTPSGGPQVGVPRRRR